MNDLESKNNPAMLQRHSLGVTLVELLIGMSILGVILLAASGVLQVNSKATNDTQVRSNALGDARGAISRMTETISQAAYIYPTGLNISFLSKGTPKTITTGDRAIAALISSAGGYEGVVYYVADRTEGTFASDLPSLAADRIAQHILVEARTQSGTPIPWPAKTVPRLNWDVPVSQGVLVDGIDVDAVDADGKKITKLMTTGTVISPLTGSDAAAFVDDKVTGINGPKALISTVGYSIGIRVATNGKTLADSGTTVLRGLTNARNVPRQ
jgi:prepilin-type N-terminal cleavage/methylation domain-containing protein